jgi:ribosomal protein L10
MHNMEVNKYKQKQKNFKKFPLQ